MLASVRCRCAVMKTHNQWSVSSVKRAMRIYICIYTRLNLECCKCVRMRFHCAMVWWCCAFAHRRENIVYVSSKCLSGHQGQTLKTPECTWFLRLSFTMRFVIDRERKTPPQRSTIFLAKTLLTWDNNASVVRFMAADTYGNTKPFQFINWSSRASYNCSVSFAGFCSQFTADFDVYLQQRISAQRRPLIAVWEKFVFHSMITSLLYLFAMIAVA